MRPERSVCLVSQVGGKGQGIWGGEGFEKWEGSLEIQL